MQELRISIRQLLKKPGPTLLALLALALGIGLVSAQLSFMKGVILADLPFEAGHTIMHLHRVNPQRPSARPTPLQDYLAWRDQQTTFEDLGAYEPRNLNVRAKDQSPQRYLGAAFSANLLPILRVKPSLGRSFLPTDEKAGAPPVVLLGHRIWQRDFSGQSNVVGQPIQLDGEPATVIGVLPEGFLFPLKQEIWSNLPLETAPSQQGPSTRVEVIGRLKETVTLSAAQNELNVIAERRSQTWPENRDYPRIGIKPYTRIMMDTDTAPVMISMLAMVAGVMLIACTNVATLMLAQAVRRTRELAIRAALGASRRRLIRQTLLETCVLAIVGGLLGLLLAQWWVFLLESTMGDGQAPFWWDLSLDLRVVAGTAALTLLAGVLCGLMPAWQASRANFNEGLKETNPAGRGLRLGRFSRSLVHVQVIFCGALLVLTVLMAKSVTEAYRLELPFTKEGLLTAQVDLAGPAFRSAADRISFYNRLVEHLESQPGIESATVTSRHPLGMGIWMPVEVEGDNTQRPAASPPVVVEIVGEDYFHTLNAPLVQGRAFGPKDAVNSQGVAIVNESFASRHWPDALPIGKRLRTANSTNWATVVGVAPDLPMRGIRHRGEGSGVYFPQAQKAWGSMTLLLRARGEPRSWESVVQQAVWALAPDQPVQAIQSLDQTLADQWAGPRFFAKLFTVFGSLAVFLAMLGVYGVMSFTVAQRTREFGIRFALGALPAGVKREVLRQGVRYLLVGLPIAFLLAFGLSLPFGAVTGDVPLLDPTPYGVVALAMSLVILLAAWIPARRAASVDPVVALRSE